MKLKNIETQKDCYALLTSGAFILCMVGFQHKDSPGWIKRATCQQGDQVKDYSDSLGKIWQAPELEENVEPRKDLGGETGRTSTE